MLKYKKAQGSREHKAGGDETQTERANGSLHLLVPPVISHLKEALSAVMTY